MEYGFNLCSLFFQKKKGERKIYATRGVLSFHVNIQEYSFDRAMLLNNYGLLLRETGDSKGAIESWRTAAYLPDGLDSTVNLVGEEYPRFTYITFFFFERKGRWI